jgi:5'-methylthioadenosine phosphorylase
MQAEAQVGIIGGSGLYDLEGMAGIGDVDIRTPFGSPSGPYALGELAGVKVAFLARHGQGHRFNPSEVNYRANIFGFKQLGVHSILAVTAVGSLREDIKPLDVVLPDQFYDRTRHREDSFFVDGLVAHISFDQPTCQGLAGLIATEAGNLGAGIHPSGSLVCIEGPAFSTKAESHIYREWGLDIIGMTSLTEAKLAREAEICYQPMAMVTDYDCWHEAAGEVTVEMVVENMRQNSALAKSLLQAVVPRISSRPECLCRNALKGAIMTSPDQIPYEVRARLDLIAGKYLK